MPKLIKLYVDSVLVGFVLAICFVVLLVLLDVAQLGRLVLTGRDGLLAAGMMTLFFGGLFASVQFALRVVTLDQRKK
jgi:formate hydrogenlyase subunit 3/multisubunit Na+/H+ antiporter MnhD subunit